MDISEIDQQLIGQLTSGPDALDKFLVPVIKTLIKGNRVDQFAESVKKYHAQQSAQLAPVAKASYKVCSHFTLRRTAWI